MSHDPRMEDWVERARSADILATAQDLGAKLKKTGGEWIGPCPECGGRDRFGVNPGKRKFVCRGASGGDVISMVMHVRSVDFLGACEIITKEPPPRGKSKPLSDDERRVLEEKRVKREEEQRRRRLEEDRQREVRAATAAEVWDQSRPIAGTLAEKYLIGRRIPVPPVGWPEVLRFHPRRIYERDSTIAPMPCLIARVDDVCGNLTAVWQIYLTPAGTKAQLENPKIGLGPAAGGAVRMGGVAERIGVAEGLETGLAVWTLIEYRYPVWPTLSTSGMIGFEPPLMVKRTNIFPDGDPMIRRRNGVLEPEPNPPGMRAARALHERLAGINVPSVIETPLHNGDFLNGLQELGQHEQA